MKWLLVLFATYMLVLPCIPCNAVEVCCEEEEVCFDEKTSPETDQHEHSATCPCCPSFCCNTCHSVVVASLVAAAPIMPERIFDIIPFADKPLANFSAIIWQPPKVLC